MYSLEHVGTKPLNSRGAEVCSKPGGFIGVGALEIGWAASLNYVELF